MEIKFWSIPFFGISMKSKKVYECSSPTVDFDQLDRDLEDEMLYNRPSYNCSYYGDPLEFDWHEHCDSGHFRREKWHF